CKYSFVGGKYQDMGLWPPGRYLESRIATVGQGRNGLGLNFIGHIGGMVTNGFGNIPICPNLWGFVRHLDEVRILYAFQDTGHSLYYLNGIIANRGFP